MSKMSKEEWSAQVPKEFVDNIPDEWHEKNIPGMENLYKECTSQYFPAEKQFQEGVKQKISELQEHIKTSTQEQNVNEELPSSEDQGTLLKQIDEIKGLKVAAHQESESNSAKLQQIQQSNNELDQQIKSEKAIIEGAQQIHNSMQENNQNALNDADAALMGAENEDQ